MKRLTSRFFMLLALSLGSLTALADPPGRVGRLSYLDDGVTIQDLRTGESAPASLNWPVVGNSMISTFGRSLAELRIGSTAVRIDGGSELEIVQLDDDRIVLRLNHGTASVRLRNSDAVRDVEIDTPQAHILPTEPSTFRVEAGLSPGSSAVRVFAGRVRFEGGESTLTVSAGRRAEIDDGDIRLSETRGTSLDVFDQWSLARDERDERSESLRYVSPEMTGYEDLDSHGRWQTTVEYGPVWYPYHVSTGWAPYRNGRWTWIEPWGWTWVDSAPWGYAPFHYGRWAQINRRWCWAPGQRIARPVWAPALVGWVGGNNWSLSISSGRSAVGWFPLAPREIFVPRYSNSNLYARQVNAGHVAHWDETARNNHRYRHYGNHAVTVLPNDFFRSGRTVAVPAAPAIRGLAVNPALRPAVSTPPPAPAVVAGERPSVDHRDSRSSWRPGNNTQSQTPPTVVLHPSDNVTRGNRTDERPRTWSAGEHERPAYARPSEAGFTSPSPQPAPQARTQPQRAQPQPAIETHRFTPSNEATERIVRMESGRAPEVPPPVHVDPQMRREWERSVDRQPAYNPAARESRAPAPVYITPAEEKRRPESSPSQMNVQRQVEQFRAAPPQQPQPPANMPQRAEREAPPQKQQPKETDSRPQRELPSFNGGVLRR